MLIQPSNPWISAGESGASVRAKLNSIPNNGSSFALPPPSQISASAVALAFTASQIASSIIQVSTFQVAGYYSPGDLGAGAIYTSVGATAGGPGAVTSSNGILFNLVLTYAANVGWFGAKGDGTNASGAETAAVQAAYNAASAFNKTVYFPAPSVRYLIDKITYSGQNMSGDGSVASIIRGTPGNDIFYAPDPSTGEAGSLVNFPENFRVNGLQIQVDNSVSNSFPTRTIYPVLGTWAATTAGYLAGQYYSNSGAIYKATTAGTSGSTAPTHTIGVVSDGGVNWLFIDSAQLTVQNCAFAFPNSNGASATSGQNLFPLWNDVIILGLVLGGGDPTYGLANSGAVFSQRPMYAGHISNFRMRLTPFGLCCVPPNVNPQSYIFDSDTNGFSNIEIFCKYPLILFNLNDTDISNISIYGGHLNDRGPYILSYLGLQAGLVSSGVTITDMFFEPSGSTAGQISLFDGNEIYLTNSYWGGGIGASAYFTWAVNRGVIDGGELLVGGDNVLQVWGDYNWIHNILLLYPGTLVSDNGINRIEQSGSGGTNFISERPISKAATDRQTALVKRADFINGWAANSFPNAEDLLIGGREWLWSGYSPANSFSSSSLETGGYYRSPAPGGNYATVANGQTVAAGGRVPATNVRFYVKARGSATCTCVVSLDVNGVSRAFMTLNLTTSWAVFSVDCDLSSYSGQTIQPTFNDTSNSGYLDIAWVAFRPFAAEFLGHSALFTGGSVVLGNAALATNATDGFTYIETCAGIPTGVPTTQTGTVAMIYDTTNNNFYIYNGAWKKVGLT